MVADGNGRVLVGGTDGAEMHQDASAQLRASRSELSLPVPTLILMSHVNPTVDGLQKQIRAAEDAGVPSSPDLIQPLRALGVAYRERGELTLATAAVESAVHIVRLNFGLHSLEQAPLVRQLIANADSLGDHRIAWDLERDLLNLQ